MKTTLLLLTTLAAPAIPLAATPPQPPINHAIKQAIQAHHNGRHTEALQLITTQFAHIAACADNAHQNYFITMFEWSQLLQDDAAARVAMINERDKQLQSLLTGDAIFCAGGYRPITRFSVVIDMNQTLGDSAATYRMVKQLLQDHPAVVRGEMFRALPAIVEAGDYDLAAQYLNNPLDRLDELNRLARTLPLYPEARKAPRLSAELSNFMTDVFLLSSVLKGQGKDAEADALRRRALAGIQSDDLRALAARELAEPGTIVKTLVEHQMAQETGPDAKKAK